MNNITLAKESLKIQKDKYYMLGGEKIALPDKSGEDIFMLLPQNNMYLFQPVF